MPYSFLLPAGKAQPHVPKTKQVVLPTCFIRRARRSAVLGQCSPAGVLITWSQVLNPVQCTVCFGPRFGMVLLSLRTRGHCGSLAILWAWLLVLLPGQDFPIDNNGGSLAVVLCRFIFHRSKALLQLSGRCLQVCIVIQEALGPPGLWGQYFTAGGVLWDRLFAFKLLRSHTDAGRGAEVLVGILLALLGSFPQLVFSILHQLHIGRAASQEGLRCRVWEAHGCLDVSQRVLLPAFRRSAVLALGVPDLSVQQLVVRGAQAEGVGRRGRAVAIHHVRRAAACHKHRQRVHTGID